MPTDTGSDLIVGEQSIKLLLECVITDTFVKLLAGLHRIHYAALCTIRPDGTVYVFGGLVHGTGKCLSIIRTMTASANMSLTPVAQARS